MSMTAASHNLLANMSKQRGQTESWKVCKNSHWSRFKEIFTIHNLLTGGHCPAVGGSVTSQTNKKCQHNSILTEHQFSRSRQSPRFGNATPGFET